MKENFIKNFKLLSITLIVLIQFFSIIAFAEDTRTTVKDSLNLSDSSNKDCFGCSLVRGQQAKIPDLCDIQFTHSDTDFYLIENTKSEPVKPSFANESN